MNTDQLIPLKQRARFCDATISAKTNLRKQVKTQRGGRSQNRRIARGLPV